MSEGPAGDKPTTENPAEKTPEKVPASTTNAEKPTTTTTSEKTSPTTTTTTKEGGAAQTPAPAPATTTTAASSEHINLKVVGQDGNEVFFKIKKHTSLKKLTDAYCQRQGVSSQSIRFLFDGKRIQPDQTPKELGMEDGDIIDAMLYQSGGFY